MIRNTPLFAILLLFLFLNLLYFKSRIPNPEDVYQHFKYGPAGEVKAKDDTGAAFVDDLTKEVGFGNLGDSGAAGAADNTLMNLNVQEHQGNIADEETIRQDIVESTAIAPGAEQAGLGKTIGQQQPAAAAQVEVAPEDESHDDEENEIESEQADVRPSSTPYPVPKANISPSSASDEYIPSATTILMMA